MLTKIKENTLSDEDIHKILSSSDKNLLKNLQEIAKSITEKYYGKDIYIRALIEHSNYCIQDCYYCGIRRCNRNIKRYRLSEDEVMSTADRGYKLGFRTFVLQGGEDPACSFQYYINIIRQIKYSYPDSRLTLSIGIRTYEELKGFKEAGADRFLLRHETANPKHFARLHPKEQSLNNRIRKLKELNDLGYVVGSGFMIGSPYQELSDLIMDFKLLKELKPEMIGVGPFIPHRDTPFKNFKEGDLDLSLKIISILRILFPKSLIPATTALNTIDDRGRNLGIVHGANVLMPNLSPQYAKDNYQLYNNKARTDLEDGEFVKELAFQLSKIDRKIVIGPGDPYEGGYK